MNEEIVQAFARIARLKRQEVFDDERLMPQTSVDDAMQAAPGWVGSSWDGGTLLVGINPGGGGDNYRGNPSDKALYDACRRLKEARSVSDQKEAMGALSSLWMQTQRTHNIWRIISKIIDATGERESDIAFMNILPFRTRQDVQPRRGEIGRVWRMTTQPAISALRPARIIALGAKAYKVLDAQLSTRSWQIIEFKRRIGDTSIHPEATIVLRQLQAGIR
ncbi:MAG: hypothetical protein WA935_14845 [Sphingopyxis granuli]|uniref:hypothetical protein n=1 Tax=Sphingopyxis sp. MG TaxID=1866325 RepID=UPI000CDF4CA6|nr:hypothetical protein [Sphingopyxis sp. MG]AVA13731.1 hypothetical protein C3E99_07675 [Sphingopyxis sp. MG]